MPCNMFRHGNMYSCGLSPCGGKKGLWGLVFFIVVVVVLLFVVLGIFAAMRGKGGAFQGWTQANKNSLYAALVVPYREQILTAVTAGAGGTLTPEQLERFDVVFNNRVENMINCLLNEISEKFDFDFALAQLQLPDADKDPTFAARLNQALQDCAVNQDNLQSITDDIIAEFLGGATE